MTKTRLMISLFFLCATVFAQEYQAFDGTTYKVGDSVLIGLHTGYKEYDDIKEYYVSQYSSGYRAVNHDISFKKYEIKSVGTGGETAKKMYYDENTILMRFGTRGFLKEDYIAILDDAIRSGEIISKLPPQELVAHNQKLNDSIAFLYFVKSTSIPIEKFNKEYLYRYMNSLYTKTKEDEFEFQSSLEQAKKNLIKLTSLVDFSKSYAIFTSFDLDNYDFENKGFLIRTEFPKYYVVESADWGKYPGIYIVFPNYDKFRFVSVIPNDANSFVKRRKDKYGNINREVFAKINFKIVNIDDSQRHANERYSGNLIFGEIESIELYEYKNYLYNWIGTIK